MKLVMVSDLHASLRLPYAKVDPDGTSSDRLRDVIGIFDQIEEFCRESSVAGICIVGDLFDRQHPDAPSLIAVSGALRRLSLDNNVYILPGNHDSIEKNGKMYSLQFYEELNTENIKILGCEQIDLGKRTHLYSLPWVPNSRAMKKIRALRNGISPGSMSILLVHQDIIGAQWDSGMESEEGLDPKEVTEGWSYVFSGHYHRPQKFGTCGMYCGAPLDMRFGDEVIEQRGFWVLDTAKKTVELVPTVYPRFRTISLIAKDTDGLETLSIEDDEQYIRLIISGDRKELDKIVIPETFRDRRYFRLELKPDVEPIENRLDVDPSLSMQEMARKYVEKMADNTEKKTLMDVGLKFLESL